MVLSIYYGCLGPLSMKQVRPSGAQTPPPMPYLKFFRIPKTEGRGYDATCFSMDSTGHMLSGRQSELFGRVERRWRSSAHTLDYTRHDFCQKKKKVVQKWSSVGLTCFCSYFLAKSSPVSSQKSVSRPRCILLFLVGVEEDRPQQSNG